MNNSINYFIFFSEVENESLSEEKLQVLQDPHCRQRYESLLSDGKTLEANTFLEHEVNFLRIHNSQRKPTIGGKISII